MSSASQARNVAHAITGSDLDRGQAAADRAEAAADRVQAAADRRAAARDRAEAARLRAESANDLKSAATDELTGMWTRKFGLEEVSRELERASRTGAPLIVAFIDVDGLKQVNDSRGHVAGDALLRLASETLRAHVRPYDVVVRYGGDEFVCAMSNLSALDARQRFVKVAEGLRAVDEEHSITFGIAEALPGDSLQALIARADAELLEARGLLKKDSSRISPEASTLGQLALRARTPAEAQRPINAAPSAREMRD
jgi:diguanylate cyclase (GGDEF)-like protein